MIVIDNFDGHVFFMLLIRIPVAPGYVTPSFLLLRVMAMILLAPLVDCFENRFEV